MSKDRQPPADIDAEEDVIGSLLWGNRRVDMDDIGSVLTTAEMFVSPKLSLIYGAILELSRVRFEPVSDITVRALLDSQGRLANIGGTAYLMRLKEQAEYSVSGTKSAQMVRDCYRRRKMIQSIDGFAQSAFDTGKPVEETIACLQESLIQLSEAVTTNEVATATDLSAEFFRTVDNYQAGRTDRLLVKTGIVELDNALIGLRPGNMVVVAGRTGEGKTTLAMQMAISAAEAGKPVAIYSLEMLPEELHARLLCNLAQVDSRDMQRPGLLTDADFDALNHASTKLETMGAIHFDRSIDKSNAAIRASLRKLIIKSGVKLAVIDYIGLVTPSKRSENRTQEVTYLSREFKRMAVEFKIPIIVLSQVSRGGENREDKSPKLSDLRDSGAIEQDADIVMFIGQKLRAGENMSTIWIRKNRGGETGAVDVFFDRRHNRILGCDKNHSLETRKVS